MSRISSDKIVPGMIISADVHDRNGRLILASGIELTDKHRLILLTWGITEIEVAGEQGTEAAESGETPGADSDILRLAEERIKDLFRLTDSDHPVIRELMKLAIARKVAS